jgi:hypothetical protein
MTKFNQFDSVLNNHLNPFGVFYSQSRFVWNKTELTGQAIKEGYAVIIHENGRIVNIINGRRVNRSDTPEFLSFSKANWPDKVCWVGIGVWRSVDEYRLHPSSTEGSVTFFHRQYYKGKPTKNFVIHRDDGPAQVSAFEVAWFMNGSHSRADMPAVFVKDEISWVSAGKWHNDADPAIIRRNGDMVWYNNHEAYKRQRDGVIENFSGYVNGVAKWTAGG